MKASQNNFFVGQQNTNHIRKTVLLGIGGILVCGIIVLLVILTLKPRVQDEKKIVSVSQEPNTSKYTNQKYSFTLDVPTGYAVKEYAGFIADETIIGVGPKDRLPTGIFEKGNFVWIRIYSVVSPEYTLFSKMREGLNTSNVIPAQLGGSLAFDTSEFLATERGGNVYELHYSASAEEVRTNIISSFAFTN